MPDTLKRESPTGSSLKMLIAGGFLLLAVALLLPVMQRGPLGWFFPAKRSYPPPTAGTITTATVEQYAVQAAREAGYGPSLSADVLGQNLYDLSRWSVTIHDLATDRRAGVKVEFGERVRTETTPYH